MTTAEKYRNDSAFHRLVDKMLAMIYQSEFTPGEMREAAIFASIRYEMENVRKVRYFYPNEERALQTLQRIATEERDGMRIKRG